MLLRLIILIFLNLSISYGFKNAHYNYRVSSFSQLVKVGNKTEEDVRRHSQIYGATFKISRKTENSLIGIFETGPEFNNSDVVNQPFEVVFDGGLVTDLKVSPSATQWNIEFIRAIVGQFQISGEALKYPTDTWVMEETISGMCSTHYNKTRHSNDKGDPHYEITKTKDYNNCSKIAEFHRGIYGRQNLDALLKNSSVFTRKTVSSIKLIENDKDYYVSTAVVRSEIGLVMNGDVIKADTELTIMLQNITSIDVSVQKGSFFENLISIGGLSFGSDEQKHGCGLNEIGSTCENNYANRNTNHMQYKGKEVTVVTAMTRKIAEELGNVNDIPIKNTLERFTVLVDVIKTMSFELLKESGSVIVQNEREWFVFKSGVAMAGTLNALKAIRWFLETGAMNSNDDMELIMGLPNHCEKVTLEYLDVLFEIAMNDTKGIDTSAIIPFTSLYRRYYVEHSYQRDMLGQYASRKYAPFFWDGSKLSRILNQNDGKQLQYFIRALGNTGNGFSFNNLYQELSSQDKQVMFDSLQKLLYIHSTDKTAQFDPAIANMLFKKLWNDIQNTSSVLRLALINEMVKMDLDYKLVMTILNDVKSSPDLFLRKGTKKAFSSELFSYHSNDTIRNLTDSIDDEGCTERTCGSINQFEYESQNENGLVSYLLEAIGGYDEFPSYVSLDMKKSVRGYEKELKISGMLNYIRRFLYNDYDSPNSLSSGNIRLDYDFNQYFYAFENLSLSNVNGRLLDRFKKNNDHILIQSLSSDFVTIDLPLENGFLFRYTYNDPSHLYLKFAKNVHERTLMLDFHLVASKTEQMKVGFVNPNNGVQYLYGNDNDIHINVPLQCTLINDQKLTFTLKPLFTKGKQRIFRYSNEPFFTEMSSYPVITVAEEATYESYVGNKTLDTSSFKFDDTDRFIFEMEDDEDDDDMEWPLTDLNFGGPFRNYSSDKSTYSLTFEEDPEANTTFVVSLDLSNEQKYINITENSDYGNIKGPFVFSGYDVINLDVMFTGQTNKSLSLNVRQLFSIMESYLTKYDAKLSYHENDQTELEICGTAMNKVGYSQAEEGNKMSLYADLKFGQTCVNNSFVSVETDIVLSEMKKRNFNLTIDFRNLDDEIEPYLCMFEGEYNNTDLLAYSVNIIFKDDSKCGKSKAVTEEKTEMDNSISKLNS